MRRAVKRLMLNQKKGWWLTWLRLKLNRDHNVRFAPIISSKKLLLTSDKMKFRVTNSIFLFDHLLEPYLPGLGREQKEKIVTITGQEHKNVATNAFATQKCAQLWLFSVYTVWHTLVLFFCSTSANLDHNYNKPNPHWTALLRETG